MGGSSTAVVLNAQTGKQCVGGVWTWGVCGRVGGGRVVRSRGARARKGMAAGRHLEHQHRNRSLHVTGRSLLSLTLPFSSLPPPPPCLPSGRGSDAREKPAGSPLFRHPHRSHRIHTHRTARRCAACRPPRHLEGTSSRRCDSTGPSLPTPPARAAFGALRSLPSCRARIHWEPGSWRSSSNSNLQAKGCIRPRSLTCPSPLPTSPPPTQSLPRAARWGIASTQQILLSALRSLLSALCSPPSNSSSQLSAFCPLPPPISSSHTHPPLSLTANGRHRWPAPRSC